jgi:hypothetical protein
MAVTCRFWYAVNRLIHPVRAWRRQRRWLILRVPTDFRRPPPGRPCTDYNVVSVTTQWLVGRVFKTRTPQGDRW